MSTRTAEQDRLREADAAGLLGLSPKKWWQRSHPELPDPTGRDTQGPFWSADDLYKWASTTGDRRLLRYVPLRYWPEADRPAVYLGAERLDDHMVQRWFTGVATVVLTWALPSSPSLVKLSYADLPEADALVAIQPDFGAGGPGVSVATRTKNPLAPSHFCHNYGTDTWWHEFGIRCPRLSAVLGQDIPFWPHGLRIESLIKEWKPGNPAELYLPNPAINTTPLLRLAACLPTDSPASRALRGLAEAAQDGAARSDERELSRLQEQVDQSLARGEDAGVVVAARPLTGPNVADQDEAVKKAGWMEIFERTDLLALECIDEARLFNGGRDFWHPTLVDVDPTTANGAEWEQRLESASRPSVKHRWMAKGRHAMLVDPESDAPVVRSENGGLTVAVPRQLPAATRLTEVILEEPIWIRTEDGKICLAPRDELGGLAWGREGGGPYSLALLLDRLLRDVAGPAASVGTKPAAGLDELTTLPWKSGTVLTRAVLEAARDGRPYPRPQADVSDVE